MGWTGCPTVSRIGHRHLPCTVIQCNFQREVEYHRRIIYNPQAHGSNDAWRTEQDGNLSPRHRKHIVTWCISLRYPLETRVGLGGSAATLLTPTTCTFRSCSSGSDTSLTVGDAPTTRSHFSVAFLLLWLFSFVCIFSLFLFADCTAC